MSFGTAGRKVTRSPFRFDRNGPHLKETFKKETSKDDSLPRNLWKLARVAAAHPDEDGYVRKVKLAVADQSLDSNGTRKKPSISYFDKPIHGLILVMSHSEEDRGFPAEEP